MSQYSTLKTNAIVFGTSGPVMNSIMLFSSECIRWRCSGSWSWSS